MSIDGVGIFVAVRLRIMNRRERDNDWTFCCDGGFAHASPLMNLQQTFNGAIRGKFIALGCSIGKTCWCLFHVATLQKQHCDTLWMLTHTLRILMCCNVAIKS